MPSFCQTEFNRLSLSLSDSGRDFKQFKLRTDLSGGCRRSSRSFRNVIVPIKFLFDTNVLILILRLFGGSLVAVRWRLFVVGLPIWFTIWFTDSPGSSRLAWKSVLSLSYITFQLWHTSEQQSASLDQVHGKRELPNPFIRLFFYWKSLCPLHRTSLRSPYERRSVGSCCCQVICSLSKVSDSLVAGTGAGTGACKIKVF